MRARWWVLGGLSVAAAVTLAAVAGTGGAPERGDGDAAGKDEPWTLAAPMSQRRSYVAAAKIDDRIYVAGGMVGETGRRLALMERFDARTGSWETLPPLPQPVRAAAAAAVGDRVYVIGGQAADGGGRDVLAYSVSDGGWARRARLPAPRFNHAAVALGEKVYVLGGFGRDGEERDVFVYDPDRDTWTRSAPLPSPNHAFGAVVFRGEIWIIGGRRGQRLLRNVWVYDPAADEWRRGPPLPEPMELLGAASAGPEIHAVWEHAYRILDTRTGRWRDGPEPLVPRHALSLFHVRDRLVAVGGCTTALRDTQVVETRRLAAA